MGKGTHEEKEKQKRTERTLMVSGPVPAAVRHFGRQFRKLNRSEFETAKFDRARKINFVHVLLEYYIYI